MEVAVGDRDGVAQDAVVAVLWAKDADVIVGISDGMAQAKGGFAVGDGVLGQGWELEHAGHERGFGVALLELDLGGRAIFADVEQVGYGAAAGGLAGKRDVLAAGAAEGINRAVEAERAARQADGGAELHHGLVVVTGRVAARGGAVAGEQRGGEPLDVKARGGGLLLGLAGDAEEHALDVAIDDGDAFAKGNAGDGG